MADEDTNQAVRNISRLDADPPPDFSNTFVFETNNDQSVSEVDLTTRQGSNEALDIIDLSLEQMSSQHSRLGTLQNS